MDFVIRRALPADTRALTRVAHAAKRHWGYPEDWIRPWRGALTVTPRFVEHHPVYCAVLGPHTQLFAQIRIERLQESISFNALRVSEKLDIDVGLVRSNDEE